MEFGLGSFDSTSGGWWGVISILLTPEGSRAFRCKPHMLRPLGSIIPTLLHSPLQTSPPLPPPAFTSAPEELSYAQG